MDPGTVWVVSGASSNSAFRFWDGDEVVKLSTMDTAGSEGFREPFAVPSTYRGIKGRSSRGDSGENEGKDVKDLSEMEDAELDI